MIEGEHLELGNEALVSKQSGRWLPKLRLMHAIVLGYFRYPFCRACIPRRTAFQRHAWLEKTSSCTKKGGLRIVSPHALEKASLRTDNQKWKKVHCITSSQDKNDRTQKTANTILRAFAI